MKGFEAAPKNLSKEEIDDAMRERGMVPPDEDIEVRRNEVIESIFTHGAELSELKESLPFTGLDPIVYENLKREEAEFPEYVVTPIDELISRFKAEGMKIVPAKDPKSPNVMVVPWGSTDYDSDSIMFRHLQVYGMVDVRLKNLISSTQEYKKLSDTSS